MVIDDDDDNGSLLFDFERPHVKHELVASRGAVATVDDFFLTTADAWL